MLIAAFGFGTGVYQNTFSLVVVGMLLTMVAMLLGGGGYMIFRSFKYAAERKKVVFWVIVATVSTFGIWMAVGLSATTFPNPYVNSTYGFSIKYPEGWFVSENPRDGGTIHIVAFLAPDDTSARILVRTINMQGKNLDEHIKERKEVFSASMTNRNLVWLEDRSMSINGQTTTIINYIYIDGQAKRVAQAIFQKDGNSYNISYQIAADKYDVHVADFEHTARSFTFE